VRFATLVSLHLLGRHEEDKVEALFMATCRKPLKQFDRCMRWAINKVSTSGDRFVSLRSLPSWSNNPWYEFT
jgi:hypothetical protein